MVKILGIDWLEHLEQNHRGHTSFVWEIVYFLVNSNRKPSERNLFNESHAYKWAWSAKSNNEAEIGKKQLKI